MTTLLTKKKKQKKTTDEWIKKMWYIRTMEYNSAIKANSIMPLAATWVQRKIIILNKVNQKDKHRIISLIHDI